METIFYWGSRAFGVASFIAGVFGLCYGMLDETSAAAAYLMSAFLMAAIGLFLSKGI